MPINDYSKCRWIDFSIKRHRTTGWEKKKKTQLHATYKRLASALRTHVGSKWRDGERYSMQMETKRGTEVVILISDKTGFDSKPVTGCKDGHYIMIKG